MKKIAALLFFFGFIYTAKAQYISSIYSQVPPGIVAPSTQNNPITRIKIDVGPLPVVLDSILVTDECSTGANNNDMARVKMYYTDTSSVFSTSTLYGTPIVNPGSNSYFISPLSLILGSNYFWIAYDIKTSPPAVIGDYIGAIFDTLYINGFAQVPDSDSSCGIALISNSTGITNSNTSAIEFNIYPNAASDFINVDINIGESKNLLAELYNVYGKKIKSLFGNAKASEKQHLNISLEDISSGIYLIRVKTDGIEETKKIVKL
jgi:hypothetical protein